MLGEELERMHTTVSFYHSLSHFAVCWFTKRIPCFLLLFSSNTVSSQIDRFLKFIVYLC